MAKNSLMLISRCLAAIVSAVAATADLRLLPTNFTFDFAADFFLFFGAFFFLPAAGLFGTALCFTFCGALAFLAFAFLDFAFLVFELLTFFFFELFLLSDLSKAKLNCPAG
ncbi:MAG: hypothetical protein MUO22_05190 [Sedimentisphaerales bacterium]|nr:hypothetical protein [Sedimentisphaerales bacterium]